MTPARRAGAGLAGVYPVRFADGFTGCAWEDELLREPAWERPDPPPAPSQSVTTGLPSGDAL